MQKNSSKLYKNEQTCNYENDNTTKELSTSENEETNTMQAFKCDKTMVEMVFSEDGTSLEDLLCAYFSPSKDS